MKLLKWIYHKEESKSSHKTDYLIQHVFFKRFVISIFQEQEVDKYTDVYGNAFHNHPFSFLSLILYGGYREDILDVSKNITTYTHKPGSILFRHHTMFHRVYTLKKYAVTFHIRTYIKQDFSNLYILESGEVLNYYQYYRRMGYSKHWLLNNIRNKYA